ncbi:MAG: serine/threonine protein kinase, partial [Myxococcaceae bacterium]|nr:serine/threonine protein kinase [Myxococcaceae bacterium]
MSSLGGETTSCSKCGSALGPHDLDCPRCGEPRVDDRTLMRREAVTPAPEVLNGKWKMERELGHGGMGSVHLATDLQLDRQVAIKTLAANLSANEEVRTRFEREAKMMAKLDHPNLVPIYEVGRKGELPYIVMKFLEGETLGDALKRRGPLPVEEVGAIVKQVCAGLAFVHGKGFVHRDIKPANIFLSPDGHVTILDLGVAHDTSSHHTKTGMVIGTPRYMSPEQILGRKVDLRSDLYAVGTVLFELLTGSPVFGGDSDFSVMKSHAEVEPPDPSELSAAVSPSVSAVVRRALAKDPAARFQSAQELSAAFLAAVQGTLAPAYETPARQPAAPTRPALAPTRTVAPR